MFPFNVAELTCNFEGMYPRTAKDKAQSDHRFREFLLEMDACRDQISLTWPTEKKLDLHDLFLTFDSIFMDWYQRSVEDFFR